MEKQTLPNSTLILVFGILSIVTCCCYGILGLIFGIVALVQAKKALKLHAEDPDAYEGLRNVKTGRVLAIIGIVLSALYLLFSIGAVAYFGLDTLQDPEKMQELLEQYQ